MMIRKLVYFGCVLAAGVIVGSATKAAETPSWAYLDNPPGVTPAPDTGAPLRVPDSDGAFTLTQIRNLFFSPDWHPADHSAMPSIVSEGRKPNVRACGSCHRSDGSGGPENAKVAGLPADYIAQQMRDFRSGVRKSSVMGRIPPDVMVASAKDITDEEIAAAAAYFSAQKPRQAIKVVEADTIPKTMVTGWHFAVSPDGGTQPIGQRVVEVPENLAYFSARDGRAQFVAYVPPGSVKKGEELALTGGSKTVSCRICHGQDLKGLGDIPGIAGRSPSYVVRQLHDFQSGARAGTNSALMKGVVENLSVDDMVALAAYTATLSP
jgi:cytochrome c553